jgi:hypothetical protein
MYEAWQRHIIECMKGAGFDYDPVEFSPSSYGLDYISPLDRAVAEQLGYHQPSDGVPPQPSGQQVEATDALTDCANAAMSETFGRVSDFTEGVDAALASFDAAIDRWASTTDARTTTNAWSACMSERGYDYVDPDEPRRKYGEAATLTDVEVATRLADIDCDIQVRLTETRKAWEEAAADAWIGDHSTQVAALTDQKREYDATLDTLEQS